MRRDQDVLVLGGGTAGCVLAARLSQDPERTVCLVEAGPDYGPRDSGAWPTELLDPRAPVDTHDWYPGQEMSLSRARVIGGCSAHNACFVSWGHPDDYDDWDEFAAGWSFEVLEPCLSRARAALSARGLEAAEIGPWAETLSAAAAAAGIPAEGKFNDSERPRSVAPIPVNINGSTRWNAAFAYLDEARERPNLTVVDAAIADRVTIEGERVTGARLIRAGEALDFQARTVILSAGAYGSPSILLRSGIGPRRELERLGVRTVLDRPGVGSNLIDHAGASVVFGAGTGLAERLSARTANGRMVFGGPLVRLASRACAADRWDLHLVGWCAPDAQGITSSTWRVQLTPYLMKPRSTGRIRLATSEPDRPPEIDPGFLSDPDGADLEALVDGIDVARRIVATAPAAEEVDAEAMPGPDVSGREAIAEFLRANARGYYHPVGTCRMGRSDDRGAVVDAAGRVHGVEGLRVCDASIMPITPAAGTNLTTVAIAERIAAEIDQGGAG